MENIQEKIKIEFPDGNVKEFQNGISGIDIAKSISEGLFRQSVAIKINDIIYDLRDEINNDSKIEIITTKSKESLPILRHTTAHIFAEAIREFNPNVNVAIGPFIENGFYYDIDIDELKDEDLSKIEEIMRRIIKENNKIEIEYMNKREALKFYYTNSYKQEIINDIFKETKEDNFKFYNQGNFKDLCRGPHLLSTGQVGAFKLEKITRVYWKADANNKQIFRVYGNAFWKKSEMDKYYEQLEEAKKRDHRVIGKQMKLFSISEYGAGFPFLKERGMEIWNELLSFWREVHRKHNYKEVKTPIILNKELWVKSGHWENYKENMYSLKIDNIENAIKPMNCPGGMLLYKEEYYSYRDLPLRVGEIGHVHRHELSGTLSGLFRVRTFHQDDAHIFMREDQIGEEILGVLKLVEEIYKTFGLDYHLELSTRPEKSIGTDEQWKKAEQGLKDALEEYGKGYKLNPKDGAFYGPKIDVHIKDCIGRTWQCGTIQLDMSLPERFNLTYVDENSKKVRPVMIHRVIYGSVERFLGILIEHFAGKFPLWLAPVQIILINVADRHKDYCEKIRKKLIEKGFRVETDYDNQTVSNKIRLAQDVKPNYIMVLGDNDEKTEKVSVRGRDNKTKTYLIDEFVEKIVFERDEKLFESEDLIKVIEENKKDFKYLDKKTVEDFNKFIIDDFSRKIGVGHKGDSFKLKNYVRLSNSIRYAMNKKGDIYEKAGEFLKRLCQSHPFESANRRTSHFTTLYFIRENIGENEFNKKYKNVVLFNKTDGNIMNGIRLGNYYKDEELVQWLKTGKIRPFEKN
jgi:threonyl-tRNA synthetase